MYDGCEMCGGPLVLIGTLGGLDHLTCRDCGMQFSRPHEEPEAHDWNGDCGHECQCDVCFNKRRDLYRDWAASMATRR